MEYEVGHFSHRWQHHTLSHHHHRRGAKSEDDLKHFGLVLTAGRVVGGLAALGWTIYAAKKLDAEWGQLSTILAYAAVASVFTDLGIPLALTELSCRHTSLDRHVVFHAIRRHALLGSVSALILVMAWNATSTSNGRWGLAALYGISVTVTPVTGSFLALLRGKAIGGIEACYEAGRQLTLPVMGIAILEFGLGVYAVLALYVCIDLAGATVVAVVGRRRLGLTGTADTEEMGELRLRETVPLSATTIVGSAYDRVDSALLAPLAGIGAVGVYRMISPIVGASLMPAKAFGDAAAVGAGRSSGGDERRVATKFALRAVLITAPIAAVLAVVAPIVLPHLLHTKPTAANPNPTDWSTAAGPLRILLLAAIPSAALATLTPVAVVARRDRVFFVALAALVLNIVCNLVLVPDWALGLGPSGAALSFLITESLMCGLLWFTLGPERATTPTAPTTTATPTTPPTAASDDPATPALKPA